MFQNARVKLTAWYLTIIMAISLAFSAVIYTGLTREVDRFARGQRAFIQRRMQEHLFYQPDDVYFINPDLVSETKHRILILLGSINLGIVFLAGGLGYMLAGRTLRPIADMVDEQNRFISDASHELKTPLTSLKSAFEVHLRNKTRTLKEADTIVSESINEVNNLQKLSESLLTLANYPIPNGNGKPEKLELSDLIDEAVKKISPIAKAKSISVIYKPKHATILGHRNQIIELFVILLDNAVKYSDNGKTIVVSVQRNHTKVSISFIDHGIGIAKKNLVHVFERFYQEDNARSKARGGGYGLGLAIAKEIAEAHNGSISVISDGKKGSTFTLWLPVFS